MIILDKTFNSSNSIDSKRDNLRKNNLRFNNSFTVTKEKIFLLNILRREIVPSPKKI